MPSSTSSSEHPVERTVPDLPWSGILVLVAVVVVLASAAWEFHCRSLGYVPGLDDTSDLWVEARRAVAPDSTVIIGSSRGLFDLDLDVLEKGLGTRPVQLALVGSCAYPVLRHLADDLSFHGTVICDTVPALLMVPPFAPPYLNAEKAIKRYHDQTWSQRWSHLLSIPLEHTFACLQQDDLTLTQLFHQIPIPDRAKAQIGPTLPPYFSAIDRDRRTRLLARVETDQVLRDRIRNGWPPLFTPPPRPVWIPDEAFGKFITGMSDGRFAAMAKAVADLRARGGKVVFLRNPSTSDLRALEERLLPKAVVWDRLLKETAAPGIWFEDHPELTGFDCPEWSHLSAEGSATYTQHLTPILASAITSAN